MRISHITTGLLFFVVLAIGCVRKTKTIDPAPSPVAGKGGHANLRITPKNRERNIDSCLVRLKYNAFEGTDTMKYDDTAWVVRKDGKPIAEFDSLKQGDYYFSAIGWDADIADTVLGHSTFKIVDTLPKTYDLYLDVFPKH
jgi:hypothetical protein